MATAVVVGGRVDLDLYGRAGAAAAPVLGLPGARLPLGPLGELWLEPSVGSSRSLPRCRRDAI